MIRVNGLEFHVEIEGDGAPLLLLHGYTGSVRSWDDIRPSLAKHWTVVTLDLIGHGRTASPPDPARYSLEWSAQDLLALVDACELTRVDLLGYSMGGRVALHFAVEHPERVSRVILESASPGIEDATERASRVAADDALAQRILTDGIAPFVEMWERQPLLALEPHVSEAVRARQHDQRLLNNPVGLANSLRGMGAGQQQPLWSQLTALDLPVRLIVGESDFRYQAIAQRMLALLPQVELNVVPRAGHSVHLDQPAEFLRALTSN